MVEVIGDVVIPLELVIPDKEGSAERTLAMSGAYLFVSGAEAGTMSGQSLYMTIAGTTAMIA